MERLIWKRDLDGYTDVGLRDGVSVGDAICHLAEYEDTGLKPENVKDLLKRFENLYNIFDDLYLVDPVHFQAFLERVKRWYQAEKDGRLGVLPPNAPLTLEQLREMDGEPVWVTRAGYQSRWALVFVFSKRENIIRLTFDNGNQPIAKTLLDGCKIYRRKPEKKAPREGGTA